MLQSLWKEKLSWDQSVPDYIVEQFNQYQANLNLLVNFQIERKLWLNESKQRHVIGFCYCAAVFARSFNDDHVRTNLICSRTRISPLKELTIPKLELQACLLLAKLIKKVSSILGLPLANAVCFSNSMVALSWLNNPLCKSNQFVFN